MLEELKKRLGIAQAQKDTGKPAEGAAFSLEDLQEVLDSNTSLEAAVASLTADLSAATAKVAELQATLDAASAQLATAADAKAKAEADAKATKLEARKSKLVEVVGETRAAAFLAVADTLDDASFEAMTSALKGTMVDEAGKPLFNEVGVDANADTTKLGAETPEMKILREKYADANKA